MHAGGSRLVDKILPIHNRCACCSCCCTSHRIATHHRRPRHRCRACRLTAGPSPDSQIGRCVRHSPDAAAAKLPTKIDIPREPAQRLFDPPFFPAHQCGSSLTCGAADLRSHLTRRQGHEARSSDRLLSAKLSPDPIRRCAESFARRHSSLCGRWNGT